MKQPEAMRLADALEATWKGYFGREEPNELNAAAELRRLHEVNQELLEALKMFVAWSEAESNHKGTTFLERVEMLRELDAAVDAAITKATGES